MKVRRQVPASIIFFVYFVDALSADLDEVVNGDHEVVLQSFCFVRRRVSIIRKIHLL